MSGWGLNITEVVWLVFILRISLRPSHKKELVLVIDQIDIFNIGFTPDLRIDTPLVTTFKDSLHMNA